MELSTAKNLCSQESNVSGMQDFDDDLFVFQRMMEGLSTRPIQTAIDQESALECAKF
jgi:hypothetical protein